MKSSTSNDAPNSEAPIGLSEETEKICKSIEDSLGRTSGLTKIHVSSPNLFNSVRSLHNARNGHPIVYNSVPDDVQVKVDDDEKAKAEPCEVTLSGKAEYWNYFTPLVTLVYIGVFQDEKGYSVSLISQVDSNMYYYTRERIDGGEPVSALGA